MTKFTFRSGIRIWESGINNKAKKININKKKKKEKGSNQWNL